MSPRLLFTAATCAVLCACGGAPVRPAAQSGALDTSKWPVLLAGGVGGLGLFHDESDASAVLLASWATSQGMRVAPPRTVSEVFARAYRGEDVRTGASCGLPLSASNARERYASVLGHGGRLEADVACRASKPCMLNVTATRGKDRLAAWQAPFDTTALWPEALRKALGALSPARDDDAGGGGLGVVGKVNEAVAASPERLAFSSWGAASSAAEDALRDTVTLAGGAETLRSCVVASGGTELLVRADAGGRIDRCESRDGGGEPARCACAIFTKSGSVAPAARGQRLVVGVSYRAADLVVGQNVVVASVQSYFPLRSPSGEEAWGPLVSDPSIAQWDAPKSQLVPPCFADLEGGAFHLRVRTTFDAMGKATVSKAIPRKDETPTAAQVACVERLFLSAQAPCPSVPSSTADAVVTVETRPLARPAPAPPPR